MNHTHYAELLCKSNFSFLRGASQPSELVSQAAALGLNAIALTDLGGVYGIPKAYLALREFPQVKLISGAEIPVEGLPSITLLARDRPAYGLMCRILTEAHHDRTKNQPLLSWKKLLSFLEEPPVQGLIALPTDGVDTDYATLKEIFNDRLRFPLFRFLDGKDEERFHRALEIRKHFAIPIVASNDVHFHTAERGKIQDVLTSIRVGVPCREAGFSLFMNHERYMKSPEQMALLFEDLPEAITESVRIAESCTFSPSELRYRYPSEWIPTGHTAQSYLTEEVIKGAHERYHGIIPDAVEKQLKHEIDLIAQLGFADYFLTVYEIVAWARNRKILCQGRGSAANSVVCYCLGITAIDPVRMNLLFERFISPERGEPPDIDVDFEHERREEVIQHIYEKYGRDRAAMVSAVVTYRSRSALREVAKALGVPIGTLSAREVEKQLPTLIENNPQRTQIVQHIEKITEEIRGFPRHLSIHSGGFTLSADALTEIVPVEPATLEGRTIIQWDKYDLDALGLLKIDILALGMLSALKKTLDLVGMELHEIPPDDQPTYRMIQKADTVGTFQIESRAQMNMLPRLLPQTFYDLVIQIALIRPGPIVGKMVHPFLRRRNGLEPYKLPNPQLEPILGRTLGVPIFQEQVMKMAIVLADFTPGEADQLRRAIGAWRSSGSINQVGQRLMQGLLKNGIPKDFADLIFEQIKGFSEYGFPESHAASFALIAYASAYLKCHHPAEFLCCLINSQPMGFYTNATLVDDAKRHGVKILPVHPSFSHWDCQMEGIDTVRLGFRIVRGMHRKEFDSLLKARTEQVFQNLADFLWRSGIRKNVARTLALGDALICFKVDQRHALWAILAYEVLCQNHSGEQLQLFASNSHFEVMNTPVFNKLNDYQSIQADYQSYGLSPRGHPMASVRNRVSGLPKWTSGKIKEKARHGGRVEIAGLTLVIQRPPTAKGTVFATLEDEEGFLDLILWGKIFDQYREMILDQGFLIVQGKIQREGQSISLLVQHIKPFPATLDLNGALIKS